MPISLHPCNVAPKKHYNTPQQQYSIIQAPGLDNTGTQKKAMVRLYMQYPCLEMICVFCSIILQVEKIPPPTIIQIYCENGQKSSPTPIELVYFDNIGSLNHRTCSLCAAGNFVDFIQLFFFEHLFTSQV